MDGAFTDKIHKLDVRVYYEDTDFSGVVYHANYLKFAERARTEMLRDAGIHQAELAEIEGILFVVRHVTLDLKKPAILDDMLSIHTIVTEAGSASLTIKQNITRHNTLLAALIVKIACVNKAFKVKKIPPEIKRKLSL